MHARVNRYRLDVDRWDEGVGVAAAVFVLVVTVVVSSASRQ